MVFQRFDRACVSVIALTLLQQPAWTAAARAQVPAQANRTAVVYDIPAQPMASALAAYARASGLRLDYDAAVVRQSAGLKGTYSRADALTQLLAGSGLGYRFSAPGAVTVYQPEAAQADAAPVAGAVAAGDLAPIVVQGGQQTAWGPLNGYVATQSAVGTKTDTPLIETPQSISVVGQEEIKARGAQSVAQALAYVPGLAGGNDSQSRADYLYLRGFKADQYLNGLRLSDGSYGVNQFDPYFLERIDVIRGPASVLYGQSAPGGIIDLVSKRPPSEPLHEVQLQVGNFGRVEGAFDVGGPIDPDGKFLYRVTGLGRLSDTQVDHTQDRRVAIAPAFTWKPNTDTTFTILGSYQYEPDLGVYYQLPSRGTVLPNPNGHISSSTFTGDPRYNTYAREQYNLGYALEHRVNDAWTVRQNMRFGYLDAHVGSLFTSFAGLDPDERTLNRYRWYDHDQMWQVDIDTQSQVKFSTGPVDHTLLFGLDYQRSWLTQSTGIDFSGVPSFDIFDPKYWQSVKAPAVTMKTGQNNIQTGLYVQDQLKIGNLTLVGSLRNDWVDQLTRDIKAGTNGKNYDSALTGRGGIVYEFDNGLAPYFSYSTSFQPTPGVDAQGNAFLPTKGTQYEGGVKYQPQGFNGFLTAAVFDIRQSNVLTTDRQNPGFSIQTGEVHSRGVELGAVVSPIDGLNLRFSYTYQDVINSETNDPTMLGKAPLAIPKNLFSAWGDYTFASGDLAGLGLGLGVRYQSSTRGDYVGDSISAIDGKYTDGFKVPDFAVVDAMISYDLGAYRPNLEGLKVAINASNLFDKEYVSYCNATFLCNYGLRRTVIGTLSYKW